jgi:hypothetical protein
VYLLFSGHVASIERGKAYAGFWWGNVRERNRLEDPGIDRRIVLRWIYWKWDFGAWIGSSCLGKGTVGGYL